jgi:Uma2 family endonuclease
MATAVLPRVSPEEYLAIERQADTKSSYIDGEIIPMPGASRVHNLIMLSLGGELRARMKGRACEVFASDMRVLVSDSGMYTYPDIVVVRGQPQLLDNHFDTLLNPTVIIEVLSSSTESFDRGRKLQNYQRLDSLCEYILVSQDEPLVERMVRNGDSWSLTEFRGLDAIVRFESLDCEVASSEIYDRVFPVKPESNPPN